MGLTSIVPNPDDLKRTMGTMPPLTRGIGQPPGPEPTSGMASLGGLPPLQSQSSQPAQLSGLKPIVTNPRQEQEQALQAALTQKPQGFWENLRHVAGMAGRVAGDIVAPGTTELVTHGLGQEGIGPAANQFRRQQLAGLQTQDIAQQEQASKAGLQSAQANYYGEHAGQVGVRPMTAEEATAIGHPELEGSMMDQKTLGTLLGRRDTNETRSDIAYDTNNTREQIAAGKPKPTVPHITVMQGGQPHVMERDPATGAYTVDRGIAPPNFAMTAGDYRMVTPQLDTMNGNQPVSMTINDFQRMQHENPGRFLAAGAGVPALNKTALIEDIRGNVNHVRSILQDQNLPQFSADQRAKIALTMGRGDKGAIDAMVTGEFMGSLTPEQQDYVIGLSQLVENAMAMRSVLGAGQGSEDLRDAIRRTIPTAANPTSEYSLKQLDQFENTLNRLERGVPNVPLRPQSSPANSSNGAVGGNKGAAPTANDPLGIRR